MKIAVCDDRADDRGALKALLEAYGRDFEIREYGSGKSLCGDMDYIRECGIVFLDINMEGMDGLEAARQIKAECPKVHIVLVTAYVNYALDGYKVKASRFLLKDDLEQTLQECMDDILREIRQEERVVEFGFVEGNVSLFPVVFADAGSLGADVDRNKVEFPEAAKMTAPRNSNIEGRADLDAACIAGTGYLIGKSFNIAYLTGEKGKEGICLPTGAAV